MYRHLVAAMFALSALTVPAAAQWTQVGGDFDLSLDYQVTGAITCNYVYIVQPCVNETNGITLYNNDAFARITYTGVTGTLSATTYSTPSIAFGTLHVAFGGTTPFTWPKPIATVQSFGLALTFQSLNAPYPSTSTLNRGFIWTSPTNMASFFGERYRSYLSAGVGYMHPLAHNYSLVIWDFNHPQIDATTEADYELTAVVSLIPEPATWAMMALGLCAVGVVGRRRMAWLGDGCSSRQGNAA